MGPRRRKFFLASELRLARGSVFETIDPLRLLAFLGISLATSLAFSLYFPSSLMAESPEITARQEEMREVDARHKSNQDQIQAQIFERYAALGKLRGYNPLLHSALAQLLEIYKRQGEDVALHYVHESNMQVSERYVTISLEPEGRLFERMNLKQVLADAEIRSAPSVCGWPALALPINKLEKVLQEARGLRFVRPVQEANAPWRQRCINIDRNASKTIRWLSPLVQMEGSFVEDEMLVQFKSEYTLPQMKCILETYQSCIFKEPRPHHGATMDFYVAKLAGKKSLTEALVQFAHDPAIRFANGNGVGGISPVIPR